MVDVGLEPTTQKNHGLSTTPFLKELSGVLVRLTTCNWLTNSLPKLSPITFFFRVLGGSSISQSTKRVA